MKLFAGDVNQPMQMVLMGGMDYFNKKSRWGTATLFELTMKGGINIDFKGEAKIKGK